VWSQIFGFDSELGSVAFRVIPRHSGASWSHLGLIAPLGGDLYSCFSESFASSVIETPSAAAMSRAVAQVGLAWPASIWESVGIAIPACSARVSCVSFFFSRS
jgi:hypothetical protein